MSKALPAPADEAATLIPTTSPDWSDWKWQQRNAVTSLDGLLAHFPGLRGHDSQQRIGQNLKGRKLAITPYSLRMIGRDTECRPHSDDPIWRQLAPAWDPADAPLLAYDGESENWELPEEMVTPICQHKYDNRVILRLANVCHAYCQFCFEALRTLEKQTQKSTLRKSEWAATLDYIRRHPQLDEVILSGGEPLMHGDQHLDGFLADLRAIRPNLIIRLHTRALSFNPYRVTDELVAILARHGVTAIGLHVTHAVEITPDFLAAARKLRSACPLLFANIPFLGGVNDNYDSLSSLCLMLYRHGILPHYLYHFMPFSPGSQAFSAGISEALGIVGRMKRRLSNLAVPEYVLPHKTGKYTVPLDLLKDQPRLEQRPDGEYLHFRNWQGQPCVFPE